MIKEVTLKHAAAAASFDCSRLGKGNCIYLQRSLQIMSFTNKKVVTQVGRYTLLLLASFIPWSPGFARN